MQMKMKYDGHWEDLEKIAEPECAILNAREHDTSSGDSVSVDVSETFKRESFCFPF